MSNITPQQVKELRERTGVGMSKCKEALVEENGNMEKAIEYLRKKGMAAGVKKEHREAKDGCIKAEENNDLIAMIEVNAETDFVAKNERFQEFVNAIAKVAIENKIDSSEKLRETICPLDKSISIEDYRNVLVQTLGENIIIKRLELIKKQENASYGIYVHMNGKIVCIVELKGDRSQKDLARDIAMHIAAEDPTYLKVEDVPSAVKDKEEEIARSQIKGKPDFVVDKILQGKLNAFYDQECLLRQKYVKDSSINIEQLLENVSKKEEKQLSLDRFWRWQIGG